MTIRQDHPLVLAVLDLQKEIKHYDYATCKHITPSGVFIPSMPRKVRNVSVLLARAHAVQQQVALCSFEEFACAIDQMAKYTKMPGDVSGEYKSYLHGGNFFIELSEVPELHITEQMLSSSVKRRLAELGDIRKDSSHKSPIKIEEFMDPQLQMNLWVQGHAIHCAHKWIWLRNQKSELIDIQLVPDGECCPDFSCCDPKLAWPLDERLAFANADESIRQHMRMNAMQKLAMSVDPDIVAKPNHLNA